MRFMRLGPPGSEIPVLVDGSDHLDLRRVTPDITGDFFAADGVARARAALEAGELSVLDGADEMRVGAPVARPQAVLCIGLNYAAHAAESGAALPASPVLFTKLPYCVVGPNDPVPLPPGSEQLDWEVELGFVVARRVDRVPLSDDEARSAIAGWVVADDISERAFQSNGGGQWTKGKAMPSSLPLGPVLVTPDEIDVNDVRIRSWVNGSARQDSRTGDLIFSPVEIIRDLARFIELQPGDVVVTGTPEGVALSGRFPYLSVGDVVEMEIDGLGRQRHPIVATRSA